MQSNDNAQSRQTRPPSARELIRLMTLSAGASIAALQPPRLLLGTLAVAFLAVVGSVIDAAGGGLYMSQLGLDGNLEEPRIEAGRLEMIEGFQNKLPIELQATEDPSGVMSLDEVTAACETHYLEQRAGLEDEGELQALESTYRETLGLLAQLEPVGLFSAFLASEGTSLGVFVEGVITLRPAMALSAVKDMVFTLPRRAFADHPFLMILIGLLFGFTLALFGGAIARLDALDTGLGRKSSAWIGLEYAWAHVGSYLQALLLPLGIVAVLTGLVALVGAPFNLPYLDIIGSLIYVVAIVVGLVSTILLVGFGVLTPLLIGAVAVERADAGDAIQRGWSALFTRPLQLGLGIAVALATFGAALAALDLLVVETLRIAAVSWGGLIGGEAIRGAGSIELLDFRFERAPDTTTGSATAAGAFMNFWETLVVAALLGYVFSWFATIGTRLFLAMRLLVDQQSTSVVWVPGAVPGSTVRVPGEPDHEFGAEDDYRPGNR